MVSLRARDEALRSVFAVSLHVLSLDEVLIAVQMFRENPAYCKNEKWTYSYAFFLDMGGIHLTSLDYPKGFPINSEQLFYLVKNGHVDFPDMEKMDIQERNAKDILSRFDRIRLWRRHATYMLMR
jgi:hypothetical protein